MEILGDAALFADPESPKQLATKIKRFMDSKSLREKYIELGAKQVSKYTWEETASKTIDVYRKVMGR